MALQAGWANADYLDKIFIFRLLMIIKLVFENSETSSESFGKVIYPLENLYYLDLFTQKKTVVI